MSDGRIGTADDIGSRLRDIARMLMDEGPEVDDDHVALRAAEQLSDLASEQAPPRLTGRELGRRLEGIARGLEALAFDVRALGITSEGHAALVHWTAAATCPAAREAGAVLHGQASLVTCRACAREAEDVRARRRYVEVDTATAGIARDATRMLATELERRCSAIESAAGAARRCSLTGGHTGDHVYGPTWCRADCLAAEMEAEGARRRYQQDQKATAPSLAERIAERGQPVEHVEADTRD